MILSHGKILIFMLLAPLEVTKNNHSAMLLSRTNLIFVSFSAIGHILYMLLLYRVSLLYTAAVAGSNTTSNTCYESLLIADSSCSKQKWCKNPSLSRASRCQTGLYLLGVGIAGVNVLELGGVVAVESVVIMQHCCRYVSTVCNVNKHIVVFTHCGRVHQWCCLQFAYKHLIGG